VVRPGAGPADSGAGAASPAPGPPMSVSPGPVAAFAAASAAHRVIRSSAGVPLSRVGRAARFPFGSFSAQPPSEPYVHVSVHTALRWLFRVRDWRCVDKRMATAADNERLAAHSCHKRGPSGLERSRLPEVRESRDLVYRHRCVLFA
jgi:hypothetical protein